MVLTGMREVIRVTIDFPRTSLWSLACPSFKRKSWSHHLIGGIPFGFESGVRHTKPCMSGAQTNDISSNGNHRSN